MAVTFNLQPFPPHLLASNDVPSDAEAREIKSILNEDSAILAGLDLSLKEERSRIDQHIRQGCGILSAVRRLPFDILAEVFIHSRGKKVLLLGRICRRWKAVTLALPVLWSYIERGLPLPAIAAHLENSNPCPLTISLSSSEIPALHLVVQHSERWEVVALEMGPEIMLAILAQIHGKLPLLRRVDYRDYDSRAEPCRAFEIAPRLSEASIRGSTPVVLPWAQLQRVFLAYQVFDVTLDQLKLAKSLVELNLMTLIGQTPNQPIDPIRLPRLLRLFIDGGNVLDNLTCPSLEELFIGQDKDMSVIPFLNRIISILNQAPTLFELRLIRMYGVEELLPYLTTPSDDEHSRLPGPELRAITLPEVDTDDRCALLVKMMESRRASGLPALSLCVLNYKDPRMSSCALRTLSELQERGFEVEWLVANAAREKPRSWELDYMW
ncbi:hypothetical protein B0H11DRAFT_2062818 [Mycena galericulata]|nr:hypothetical protein B0H11DRAFT_2062818 [Mycena galericulata]